MMKLYYSKGACSLVPRIVINELKLKCEYEAVNLKTKQTESGKDFFTINPKGCVPVLENNNKEILTENAVILQYLAESNHANTLLPEEKTLERYRILEWLNYVATELHKSFSPLFNPAIPIPVKEQIFIPTLKAKLTFVDKHFTQNYITGNHFTLPDAYLFVMLTWGLSMKFNLKEWPHLSKFFNEMQARPSIELSLKQEGLTVPV